MKYAYDDCSVRQAADQMINHNIGRLPVVLRSQPQTVIGILTRSDLLAARKRRRFIYGAPKGKSP